MKKTPVKPPEFKAESDKAKKIYRTAQDTIRRLDDIVKQRRAYKDVFMPEAVSLRNRLQDYCERLMFYDPLEYGRKAEEFLWRKVYYDIIQLMKHNRKQMRPSSSLESAFRTHLQAATGYYYHLLFKLQHEFSLRLEGVIDFYYMAEPKAHKKPHHFKKADPDPKMQEWARKACHRCLIYLGDVARYQQDYDEIKSCVLSQRYYYQALVLCPDIGMPHNQLGTLAGSRYYNLDAAYHYMRCIECDMSFEGAQGNLQRLFEKNRRRYLEVGHVSQKAQEQQRTRDIKRFIVRFMHLLDVFYTNEKSVDVKELQESCQSALQDFNLCLFYQPQGGPNPQNIGMNPEEKAYNLDDEIVFKIVVICMMTIYRLQKESSSQVTAAIAFSLALFSHILNHVVIRLQAALSELENPRKPFDIESTDEKFAPTDTTDDDSVIHSESHSGASCETAENSQETVKDDEFDDTGLYNCVSDIKPPFDKKKQRFQKLRRRRRRRHDSECTMESHQNFSSSDDSDLSEGGEADNASDSDSPDEVTKYLNQSPSSESDSDDNLMVSQELRPGFSITGEEQMDGMFTGNSETGFNSLSASFNSSLNSQVAQAFNAINNQGATPMDMFHMSSNFMGHQLKFSNLLNNIGEDPVDSGQDMDIKAIVQGTKNVSVPPGFDKDPEAKYVQEISQKLAEFVIETDTDTSNMPTDTDNSSLPTESEMDDTEPEGESAESVIDRTELEERRLEHLVQVIRSEGLLCSIKVYCDWMRCYPHIIATCAQSSQSLWSRLSVLLNFLPLEKDLIKIEYCETPQVLNMVKKAAATYDWNGTLPLKEDLHVQNFKALKDAHKTLQFETGFRHTLDETQEAVLRTCSLRKFGYFIARMKSISFSFDREKCIFYGPQVQQEDKASQEKTADAEARRNQLMKDMAQLRLQAEVSQLEGSLQSADQPSLPPYLVPDATALCDNLQQVKQLANCARFIIIIPLAVIDNLDFLKKTLQGAREAIRWLETEFKKGNRYVRAQKNHEKATALPHKNLKKKDKDAWRFLQIVDCCKYLAQQSSDCDPKGLVSILTNHKVTSPNISLRVRQAITAAQQEGISLQNVGEFFTKWKEVWKSNKG